MSASLQGVIRRGGPGDIVAVQPLLEGAGLPTTDLAHIKDLRLWVLEADGQRLGVVALECFGPHALLRSLAVAPEHRTRGFGRNLVARLEQDARAEGITQLTLLTETAERFFRRLGYKPIERQDVPDEVQASAEFRYLCPVSALCMTKPL